MQLAGQQLDDQLYLFPQADELVTVDLSPLRTTAGRKVTIHRFAQWFADARKPDALDNWLDIKSIGPWTVEYVKLRGLSDPDIWLNSDLGIKKALVQFPDLNANQFRPWRSYLTYHLWSHLYV